eukprot:gene2929-3588_t
MDVRGLGSDEAFYPEERLSLLVSQHQRVTHPWSAFTPNMSGWGPSSVQSCQDIGYLEDGFYVSRGPFLAKPLRRLERVRWDKDTIDREPSTSDPLRPKLIVAPLLLPSQLANGQKLSDAVSSFSQCSRMTQRILRELSEALRLGRLPPSAAHPRLTTDTPEPTPGSHGQVSERGDGRGGADDAPLMLDTAEHRGREDRRQAMSRLLSGDEHTPGVPLLHLLTARKLRGANDHLYSGRWYVAVRELDDPVIPEPSLLVMPERGPAMGGEIGQWTALASETERLGWIPFFPGKLGGKRSLLTIQLHQLSLSVHPMMIEEELLSSALNLLYKRYRALVDQGTVKYLAQRLSSLLAQMRAESQRAPTDLVADPMAVTSLRALYADLTETLPSLCEARDALAQLTDEISELYDEIERVRTTQSLEVYVIHSLMSKYVIGGEEEQEDEMGDVLASYETLAFLPNNLEADERSWKLAMRDHSRDIDQVLEAVQGLLLFAEDSSSESKSTDRGMSPSDKLGVTVKRVGFDDTVNIGTVSLSGAEPPIDKQRDGEVRVQPNTEIKEKMKQVATMIKENLEELANEGIFPAFIIRVETDGSFTLDAKVPLVEQRRRRAIQNIRARAIIKWAAYFETALELQVLSEPQSVSVEIALRNGGLSKSKVIARVELPLPGGREGQSTKGGEGVGSVYTPSFSSSPTWMSFSST